MESKQADVELRGAEGVSVTLDEGMHFVGEANGFRVDLDSDEAFGGSDAGMRPMRLLLLGMAGCTAMDVVSILRKKRQEVTGLRVEAYGGDRAGEPPKVYESIEIVYKVRGRDLKPEAVERAIELSETRYCPAIAMLRKTAEIKSRYEIEAED
jgi:putative redox protein